MDSLAFLHHHQVWLKLFYRRQLRGMWGVYLNELLRSLGMSLVGIFIPIYLYQLTGQITTIFYYYLIYHAIAVIIAPLAGKLMQRLGVDVTAILGTLLRIVFLGLLIAAKISPTWLWPSAFFWGLAVAFTWLPYHYTVVAEDDGDGKFGYEVARLALVQKLASATTPFIGGIVILVFGFTALYLVGIAFVAASVFPLLVDDFDNKHMAYDPAKLLPGITSRQNRPVMLSLIGQAFESQIYLVLRPVFVYLAVASTTQLGTIESVALLATVVVTLWAGKRVDQKGMGLMKIAAVTNALILMLLPFLTNPWEFFLHNTAYLLVSVLIWTPMGAGIYRFATGRRRLEFFIQREMVLHLAAGLVHGLLILLFGFQIVWYPVFALGSVGLFMTLLILRKVKDGQIEVGFEVRPATT